MLLTGFLMGVIIAFEIGLVAQQFGAVIFVVNGVGVAMLRELGALMTAIVLAGRTGAAFAAQIGTQKVNEEVNAISTFGLDPIYFLVLPRVLAAMLVVPLLAVLVPLHEWGAIDARAAGVVALGSFGPGALAGLFFVWGLRRVPASRASTLTLLEPLVAVLTHAPPARDDGDVFENARPLVPKGRRLDGNRAIEHAALAIDRQQSHS